MSHFDTEKETDVRLWTRYGPKRDQLGDWQAVGVFANERKARDRISSTRAVHAATGQRYSEFRILPKSSGAPTE